MSDQTVVRTPPHNPEAEMAALGSVLIKPAALDELSDLTVDDFFIPAHKEIFDAMRALAARGRPVDFALLADELKVRNMLDRLKGGENYLLELTAETPTAENAHHYALLVSQKAQLRRIIAMCADAGSQAFAGNEPEELLGEIRRRLGDIEMRVPGGPVRVGGELDRVIDAMEKRGQEPQHYLVPTGLKALDAKIGGLRSNHMIVVAANPGRGKTAWAANVAMNAAVVAGIPCLVFSLEMDKDELIERWLSRGARVNGKSVSLGRLSRNDWNRIAEAAGNLAFNAAGKEIPLYIDDRKLTASQVCAEARRWRAQHPDPRALIVIDYLGLVEPDEEERTREREVAKMSRMFKKLAHKSQANAPVILVAQLNRDNMKGKDGKPRPPQLSDLRDSGAIEADADVVVFPWWDTEPPPTGRHPARLIFGKYRGGFKGEVRIDWEPEFTTFSDPIENEDQEELPL